MIRIVLVAIGVAFCIMSSLSAPASAAVDLVTGTADIATHCSGYGGDTCPACTVIMKDQPVSLSPCIPVPGLDPQI